MNRKRALLVLVLFGALASCSKAKEADYFPMENGLHWKYLVEYKTPDSGVQQGKVAVRIDGVETIGEKEYFRMVSATSGLPGSDQETNYYRKTESGIYRISGRHKSAGEMLEFPLPLKVGMTWTVRNPEYQLTYKVDRIETAEFVDKRYEDCIRISYSGITTPKGVSPIQTTGYTYKAPHIGDVKYNLTFGDLELVMDFSLEDSNL